jgi:hypothetical protein
MSNRLLARLTLAAVLLALVCAQSLAHARPRAATSVTDPAAPVTLAGSFGGTITSLAAGGNLAYVGEGARLLILDVSQPDRPAVQSHLLVGHVVAVELSGSLAYVLTRDALRIVDVSAPQQPALRGSYRLPTGAPAALTLQGSTALIGTERALLLVDASDPTAPHLRSSLALPGRVNQIAAADGWAYVAGAGGLHSVDISSPDAPALRTTYIPTTTYPNPEATCVTLSGQVLYARFLSSGRLPRYAQVLDISNPRTPFPVANLPDDTCISRVSGGIGYTGKGGELKLYDLSTPKAPALLGTYSQFSLDTRAMYDLRAVGARIYVATRDSLTVLDATNPSQISVLGSYTAQTGPPPSPIGKGYAAVASDNALKLIDLRDPANIQQVGDADFGAAANALRIDGDLLAATLSDKTLRLFNIHDPAQPVLLSTLPISGTQPTLIGLSGGFALVDLNDPDGHAVRIIDVSNPSGPAVGGIFTPGTVWLGEAQVRAGLLYVAQGEGSSAVLKIVDIHNPNQPALLGQVAAAGSALTLSGDYAYLSGDRLSVVDVRDPAHPQLRGEQPLGLSGSFNQISVSGGLAYVAFWSGLRIYDVRNPRAPLLRANTPLNPWTVSTEGGRIYAHDGEDGLVVFDLHAERFSSPVYLPSLSR